MEILIPFLMFFVVFNVVFLIAYWIEEFKINLYHLFFFPALLIIGIINLIKNLDIHKFMMQNPADLVKFRIKIEKGE